MCAVLARGALLATLVACGDDPARVRLAPISPCGQVTNRTALRVVAFTARGELRRTVPPEEIDAFPADTEQLGVEVIGEAGRIVAVGKTAPLAFGELADGTAIPVVMGPPDGLCPVGPMTEPRRSPAVARAGDLVLVVGGTGASGEPLASAELYDPALGVFVPVPVPATLMNPDSGLAGAVLTELPDGRVALTGTASHALAYFDPRTRRFTAPILFDHRAFHGALGVAQDRLLVIGGCAEVVGGACSGPSLRTGFIYDLADVTMRERGPALDPAAVRHGARVLELGEQRDGTARFLFAGGFGEAGGADRFALTDLIAERLTGLHAEATLLDGGALLSAFAPDAATPTGSAGVLAPDAVQLAPIAQAPALAQPRLVTLEDGSALAFGSQVARYQPTTNTWSTLAAPASFEAPTLVRLADGSVLVVGGAATAEAWIYRPSLVGATSGSVIVVPDGSTNAVLTAVDPATLDRAGGRFTLVGTAIELQARALVGGPRMAQGSISAVVRVEGGGVALIAQQTSPGRALVGRLVPGEAAQIVELGGGATTVLCTGSVVTASELAAPVSLAISGGAATLSVGAAGASTPKAVCAVPTTRRGAWGLSAIGSGARVEVGPVTVARTR
jgi:hypothetical protein